MKQRLFSDDERTIIRNLDLLAQGSRVFIESGLADDIEPRWQQCVNRLANTLGLRPVADPLESDNSNDIELDGDRRDHPDDTDDEEPILYWPEINFRFCWMGRTAARTFAPTLRLSMPRQHLPSLLQPNLISLEISYTQFARSLRNRKRAETLAEHHGLTPSEHFWQSADTLKDRKIRRFDSPWLYKPAASVADALAIDASALLSGRVPPPLEFVAPTIARLVMDYCGLCQRFEKVQAAEKMQLNRPLPNIRVSSKPVRPRVDSSAESRFLRSRATQLLKAAELYEGSRNGFYDGLRVGSDPHPLVARIWQFVSEAAARRCSAAQLTQTNVTPYVEDAPLKIQQRHYFRKWVGASVWYLTENNLILAIRVGTPDGIGASAVQLHVAVYLNSLIRGRSTRSLSRCREKWTSSPAASRFERGEKSVWKRKQAAVANRFWGYWTSLDVDPDALADEREDAIDELIPVVDAFVEASQIWKMSR